MDGARAERSAVHKKRLKRGRGPGRTQWGTNHVAKNGRLSRWVILNIPLLTLLVAAACGCHKDDSNFTDMPITMSLTEAGSTKALLDATTFETPGNRIKIYDYYSAGSNETGYYYIDDVIKCSTPGLWPFEKESYKWTTDGIHKFFGWLVDDVRLNNEKELFTPAFNEGTKVLKIPTTTLGQDTPQFDFMYSDIHERNLNNNPYFTAVPLEFSHLFTAFKITAANNSSNDVWLKSVRVVGLKSTRGATLNYNVDEADPDLDYIYPDNAISSEFVYEEFPNYTIDVEGAGIKLSKSPINVSPNGEYTIMWPQSAEDFADAYIIVEYNYREKSSTTIRTDGRTTVSMAVLNPWLAGYKNGLALAFNDRTITLNCIVEPWDKLEEIIDFTEQISIVKPIKWVKGTYAALDEENGNLVLNPELTAVCTFHIDTPRNATWTASLIPLEGNADAFIIEDGTNHGVVGVESQIAIRVNRIEDIIQGRSKAILRITVETADGRTIKADLMPKETSENITEYTIIQNLING